VLITITPYSNSITPITCYSFLLTLNNYNPALKRNQDSIMTFACLHLLNNLPTVATNKKPFRGIHGVWEWSFRLTLSVYRKSTNTGLLYYIHLRILEIKRSLFKLSLALEMTLPAPILNRHKSWRHAQIPRGKATVREPPHQRLVYGLNAKKAMHNKSNCLFKTLQCTEERSLLRGSNLFFFVLLTWV